MYIYKNYLLKQCTFKCTMKKSAVFIYVYINLLLFFVNIPIYTSTLTPKHSQKSITFKNQKIVTT